MIGLVYFLGSLVVYCAILYTILRSFPKAFFLLTFVVLTFYKNNRAINYTELIDLKWMPPKIVNYEQKRMSNQWEMMYSQTWIKALFGGSLNVIENTLERVLSERDRVFSIGAGAGGVEPFLFQAMKRNATVYLSDLVPHTERYRVLKERFFPFVDSIDDPVDIFDLPNVTHGNPLLVAATLHHFEPHQVRRIFVTAIENRSPILLMDGTPSVSTLLLLPLQALSCSIWTGIVDGILEMDPLLLFLTFSGILPAIAFHDNICSALRFYSENDLVRILKTIPESETYKWDWSAMGLQPFNFGVGVPILFETDTCAP